MSDAADVNRPKPLKIDVPLYDYVEKGPNSYKNAAAVPDRREELADLLAAHHRFLGECECGWNPDYSATPEPPDQHHAHVAAVIVAAGWERP